MSEIKINPDGSLDVTTSSGTTMQFPPISSGSTSIDPYTSWPFSGSISTGGTISTSTVKRTYIGDSLDYNDPLYAKTEIDCDCCKQTVSVLKITLVYKLTETARYICNICHCKALDKQFGINENRVDNEQFLYNK